MRSRPRIKLLLGRAAAFPGSDLDVEVVLTSRSKTPVRALHITFHGGEELFNNYGVVASHAAVSLRATHTPGEIDRGEHRYRAKFPVPAAAPGTFGGHLARVSYSVAVHAEIPWWPDAHETFAVPIAWTPRPEPPDAPLTVVSATEGPRGTRPYLEVSLQSTVIARGDDIAGAVSITHAQKVKRVSMMLVATQRTLTPMGNVSDVRAYRAVLSASAPAEGVELPFRVHVPEDAPPTFTGRLIDVAWRIEIVAEMSWTSDEKLIVPVTIVPGAGAKKRGRGFIAPVGKSRRALVWRTVAQRRGLTNDPEQETMSRSFGGASLTVRLEQRAEGFWAVAQIGWSPLHVDLDVRLRKWSDALAGDAITSGNAELDRKVAVHAREAAQASAWLHPGVASTLHRFTEVRADDEGAVLSSAVSMTLPALDSFVANAVAVAAALGEAAQRVPAPRLMSDHADAWAAFAEKCGGTLARGGPFIAHARAGLETFDLGTEWASATEPVATVLSMPIDPPLADTTSLLPDATRLLEALRADVRDVRLAFDRIELRLDAPLADPATIEPIVERAAAFVRATRGMGATPFR